MKNIKGYITVATLFAVLSFGATFVQAGIIVAGRTDAAATTTSSDDPCTEPSTDLGGIIVAGITAAAQYVSGGIIVAGAQDTCGIIVAG